VRKAKIVTESSIMNREITKRTTTGTLVSGALLLLLGMQAHGAEPLRWSVTPYLWASTTELDLSFGDRSVGGVVDFPDLVDTLDAAFMIHVEGGRGAWSTFADLTYIEASDRAERTLLAIDSENQQTILDLALAWHPDGIDGPLNVFAGLRYAAFDDRYDFRVLESGTLLGSSRSDTDYYDLLLGLRYRFDLSDRWSLGTRGDFSFGDSEGSALLRAHFAYTVGKRRQNRILFGYQYKQADFEDGGLETEFRYYGPTAGFNFRF